MAEALIEENKEIDEDLSFEGFFCIQNNMCEAISKNGIFNFRVAGIAIQDGKILLHKTEEDRFWSLPGGRVEIFEFSREALLREMMEETGRKVEVGKLVWVAENFFQYNDIDHHEIGFYYTMTFLSLPDQDEFMCSDGANELLFRWFPLNDLDQMSIYPEFITSDLLVNIGNTVSHFTSCLQNLHLKPLVK